MFEGFEHVEVFALVFPILLVCLASGSAAARPETAQTPTIAEKTAGAQKLPGYFNLYWGAKQRKLGLEIDKWSSEFLYQSGLPAGIAEEFLSLPGWTRSGS